MQRGRGQWGSLSVSIRDVSTSPNPPVLSQEHQPHFLGETQHCESPEMWLLGVLHRLFERSLSWRMELIMGSGRSNLRLCKKIKEASCLWAVCWSVLLSGHALSPASMVCPVTSLNSLLSWVCALYSLCMRVFGFECSTLECRGTCVSVVPQLGRWECGCMCQHVADSKYHTAELHTVFPFTHDKAWECKTLMNKWIRRKCSDWIRFLEFGGVSEVHSQHGAGISHWQGSWVKWSVRFF